MHPRLAHHAVHESDVIHARAQRRHDFADHFSTPSVRLEFPYRFLPWAEPILEGLHLLAKVGWLTVVFDKLGLEIEEINVARASAHEKLHHPLRLGRSDLR